MTDANTTYGVTGATGGLGHGIVSSLLERGVDPSHLVAVVRNPAKAADLAARGVTVRTGDYDRPDTLRTAFDGVDVLVLVSGVDFGRRVAQHTAAIEAATTAGVSRILYTSAPLADTSSFSLVDEHLGTERVLQAGGVPATILRNNWYVENYTRDLADTVSRGVAIGSAHDGLVGTAARQDYAEAAAAAAMLANLGGAVLELAGPLVTMAQFYAALSDAVGSKVEYVDVSTQEHVAALVGAGLPEPTAAFVASIDTAIAAGELATDTGDLERLLGRPATPLHDALVAATKG